jgi:hypothetical protein
MDKSLFDIGKTFIDQQVREAREAELREIRLFFTAVGFGISEWAWMEEELVRILARLLRVSEAKAGLVAYSIINFHVWLQMIDDLFVLDGTYPKSLRKWRQIKENLKAENDVRARLAHHAIGSDSLERAVSGRSKPHLKASALDSRSKTKKFERLTAQEIYEFTNRVGDLKVRLAALLVLMKKRKSLR